MKDKLFVLFVVGVTVLHIQNMFGIELPDNQRDGLSEQLMQMEKEVSRLDKAARVTAVLLDSLRSDNQLLRQEVDSLRLAQANLSNRQTADKDEISGRIEDTNNAVDKSVSVVNHRTIIGAAVAVVIIVVLLCVWYLLARRMKRSKDTLERLQEDAIKLDNKLIELMEQHVATLPAPDTSGTPDHTLALKVADEITRIEVNLSRMDPSVKGYKQLSKAVERIKNNFLANGYEIVDMLGKPYDEGMKVIANFAQDDSLPDGAQIITGIVKPQINYNGVMIQAAQITVSQNI